MKRNILLLFFMGGLFYIIFFAGCSQNGIDKLENPTAFSKTVGYEWVIFDESLNTLGGDVLFYPSDPGTNIMNLKVIENDNAYSGKKYFHFEWNGEPIFWKKDLPDNPEDRYEASFAGISLIVATSPDFYDITPPLDMSDKGYTRIIFYAKGKVDNGYRVKFEGPEGAILDNVILTENWEKYEINLKDLDYVKDFFKVTIYDETATITNHGRGGYVDIDYIKYSK